jgi:hypothetical protein
MQPVLEDLFFAPKINPPCTPLTQPSPLPMKIAIISGVKSCMSKFSINESLGVGRTIPRFLCLSITDLSNLLKLTINPMSNATSTRSISDPIVDQPASPLLSPQTRPSTVSVTNGFEILFHQRKFTCRPCICVKVDT